MPVAEPMPTTYHSFCRWTFHAGKGGFHPGAIRPAWSGDKLKSEDIPGLVAKHIRPRLPKHIELGYELHYDTEVNEANAPAIADALGEHGMHLAMITPGAHSHFAYGGVGSLDPKERSSAEDLGKRTVDLAYGVLRKSWRSEAELAPTLVLWNGSYGYDMATVGVKQMMANLRESVAKLCKYEAEQGGHLYFGIEPKPNEGHPAMLLPTVASTLIFWVRTAREHGISLDKKGVNMEIGHSEMIGLDHVYDVIEQLDNGAMTHFHLNSQGYNDGILLGGPGKYDIDFGCRITGMNVTLARLMRVEGYNRWLGHDMQPRPYDSEEAACERVVRSILSWEACCEASRTMDAAALMKALSERNTMAAEDIMMTATAEAIHAFKRMMG